ERGFEESVLAVRRRSGAARIAVRGLLAALEASTLEVPRGALKAPLWPAGIVGSLAHDPDLALAAAAPSVSLRSVGVGIEPALPLPSELLYTVATESERRMLAGDLLRARLLFCAKEAVYKATSQLDGIFLEHHDVQVDLDALVAVTRTRRTLRLQTICR